ncbi:hypothetical protein CCR87_05470 [Rhodobaculum claviforme]|uniref:HPr kinase/phosphorylase C-terminal domain-containing protein n=1 Tax=Rhodobaculum claviforme TaxID=1549854 RepID=A0A934TKB9_9RHOB|nr:hypothetical protein [Rhodobaculum claviforme]
MLLGPSGAGKSQVALRMLALGAVLVADDRTELSREGDHLRAQAPGAIRGLIEARGIGLLRAPTVGSARVVLAVDLAQREGARMPPPRIWSALGLEVALIHAPETGCLPSALMLYLRHGGCIPP